MDQHLGKLLQWFKNQTWYDDAFIAITSDHGEMFGENKLLFHQWNYDPYDELVHVPLWVKFPNNDYSSTEFAHLVGHGDILATITEITRTDTQIDNQHIHDLRSETNRHVVSISNSSKRLIEKGGGKIQRRDGTSEINGEISDEGLEFLSSVEFPEIITSTGVALGVEDGDYVDGRGGVDSDLDQQLRALGYR
jgi:membrane-anchored protein YejM (alkaline phosphatase superfamily)